MLRLSRVLKPYRAWPDPEAGCRWTEWVDTVENNGHVMATTSSDELYLDSYQLYAGTFHRGLPVVSGVDTIWLIDNRPGTSLLATVINSDRSLP